MNDQNQQILNNFIGESADFFLNTNLEYQPLKPEFLEKVAGFIKSIPEEVMSNPITKAEVSSFVKSAISKIQMENLSFNIAPMMFGFDKDRSFRGRVKEQETLTLSRTGINLKSSKLEQAETHTQSAISSVNYQIKDATTCQKTMDGRY